MLDFLLQQRDGMEKLLRARRASRHINIDGDDLVDSLDKSVILKDSARSRAGSHGDYPLGFRHLVVETANNRSHLLRDTAGHNHQVCLPRRGAKDFGAEARNVVTGGAHRHHFNRAAGQAEGHRPN